MSDFDPVIERTISNLIPEQFPDFYREEGPLFVEFVKEYYKWLESANNSLYQARRIYDYKDIDETTDDFLVYFKEKYLKRIQLTSTTNTKQLTKHSLDLYRSKGTERGVDLLFRAVFGVETDVYYPGSDIFRLSDGKWLIPTYLEVSLAETNVNLKGKQIVGLLSGATAFVQEVVRKTVKGKLLDVLYISAINGNFQHGELVRDEAGVLPLAEFPVIIGSLNDVVVSSLGAGSGFAIGDIVDIISAKGEQGKARVVSISNTTGLVTLELLDGGYGYTVNAEILVSEQVVRLSNVIAANTEAYFELFETVIQPKANIHYENATGTFVVGDALYTYSAPGVVDGVGVLIGLTEINSTAGEMYVSVSNTSLVTIGTDGNAFHTTANAVSANQAIVNGYFDHTAEANVLGFHSNTTLILTGVVGVFQGGEEIQQITAGNVFVTNAKHHTTVSSIGGNATLLLANSNWQYAFQRGLRVRGVTSNAVGNVQNVSVDLGVMTISNTFDDTAGVFIYGNTSGANADITILGEGSGATFELGDLSWTETISLGNDFISPHLSTSLNEDPFATPVSFPANSSANLDTIINDALGYESVEIGRIDTLSLVDKGTGYTISPVVRIYEPWTYPFKERDQIEIQFTGADGTFFGGEEITQEATGAHALVISSNGTSIIADRLRLLDDDNFVVTSNSTTTIVGTDSATEANLTAMYDREGEKFIGFDALIDDTVQVDTGSITDVEIVDSGFGYEQNEEVTLSGGRVTGTGRVSLQTHGRGTGYYKKKGGFVSDQKKIFDGYYYQDYSYEIQSSLTLDHYIDLLKQVIHVAGTKAFGQYVHKSITSANVNISNVSITTA